MFINMKLFQHEEKGGEVPAERSRGTDEEELREIPSRPGVSTEG
jgi:hypothetical protein